MRSRTSSRLIVAGMSPRLSAGSPASPSRVPPSCRPLRPPVALAELRAQRVRLLEVVADELVEARGGRATLVEPVGVALVELRAQALRRRAVDGSCTSTWRKPNSASPRGRTKPRSADERRAGAHRRSARRSGRAARRRRRRRTPSRRRLRARAPRARRGRAGRGAPRAAPGSSPEVRARRGPPSSASARSCSRKSGLPSAASTMRAR